MKNKSTVFQKVVIGIFLVLALIGFLMFSTYKGSDKVQEVQVGKVVIWGTMDKNIVERIINNLIDKNNIYQDVIYIEKSKDTYREDILEALASGESPDLLLLSNENIFNNLNKIFKIPYTWFSQRNYTDTYADAFSIFAADEGLLAIPFAIDPMVMYYNKSIFKTAAVPLPPKYWDDFSDLSKKITLLDKKENIKRATIAFGESVNVNNLKGILATLMMQLGNNIVIYDKSQYKTDALKKEDNSSVAGLLFFTEFSNQTSPVYSWNRSMPNSLDYFISGRLATYFGFASETPKIRFKNPNLNFDVAEIPSIKKIENKTVFAKVWGFAIPKAESVNKIGAFNVATALSDRASQSFLSEKLFLPPVRKDLLSEKPEDAFMDIFYREAIYANSFIDPNWKESDKIFGYMIESITGGRGSPLESLKTAFDEIDVILQSKR